MTDIGTIKYERAVKNDAGGYTYSDVTNQVASMYRALQRIADMPTDPRPDGTFNYCRAAIIDIARRATGSEGSESDNG